MKKPILLRPLAAVTGLALLALTARCVAAENPPVAVVTNEITLSYGVPDVLNLTAAHIGDDVIVAFVEASGRIYNLSAAEIVYLREKGVSDRVLTTMLIQRPKAKGTNAPAAPSPWTRPPSTTTAVQTTPAYAAPATTYVVQNPTPVVYYNSYYEPYPRYESFLYPALSFAVGFGSGYYFGGYHGNNHHGSYYGGGYRGWHH
jgi:hypothetical protein